MSREDILLCIEERTGKEDEEISLNIPAVVRHKSQIVFMSFLM